METFYTPEEIANQLKVHLQTVLSYIKDGRLKALKLDKGYRISESDFNRFVHGTTVVKTPEDYFQQLGYQRKYKAFRKTSMKPVEALTAPIPNAQLSDLLESSSVKDRQGYRAFPFPAISVMSENRHHLSDGVLLEKEVAFAGDRVFFAFASNKGEILTAESLWEDIAPSVLENAIGLLSSIGIIYRGLLFIPRYYANIKYAGDVDYAFIIDRPEGRKLAMDSERGRVWFGDYIATTEDPIIIERKVPVSLTVEAAQEIALGMIKDFLWYFKCDLNDATIKDLLKEVATNVIEEYQIQH